MIFDAHAHVFGTLRGRIAAGPVTARAYGRVQAGDEEIQLLPPLCKKTAFPPETLIAQMDWAGVDRAVLVQGPFYGDQNSEVLEAVRRWPDRFVGAMYLDPWSESAREAFASCVASNGFRAVKLECSVSTGLCGIHPQARLDSPELTWLWAELDRRDLVLVIDLGAVGSRSYQTAAIRAIAERHPRLKIVIAHLGQVRSSVLADAKLLSLWEEQIDLARLPNVQFDTASLPAYFVDEGYPYPTVAAVLRRAIDRIGPRKILWGSDVPGLLGQLTYPQLVKLGALHADFLSHDERARIMGVNALELYGQPSTTILQSGGLT